MAEILDCVKHCKVCVQYVAALSSDVEYLNSRDATIMGSRNGHAPIYMWFTLTRKGYEGMRKDVERCLRNAHVLKVPPPALNHGSGLGAALQFSLYGASLCSAAHKSAQ